MDLKTWNRRRLIHAGALATLPAAVQHEAAISSAALRGIQPTPATPESSENRAGPPSWIFTVLELIDPYTFPLLQPPEVEPGVRALAARVNIGNDSEQGLNLFVGDIRLRDQAGMEYRAGSAWGSEPRLGSRNLNPGEHAQGWIWFLVDQDALLDYLVYLAPSPELRVTVANR